LREEATQVAVLPVNWRQYHECHAAGAESRLLSELVNQQASDPLQTVHPAAKREAILDVDTSQRGPLLQSYLSEQVARVLGLSALQLDIEQPLTNLGLDSLMAVELKNRISSDFGISIPMVKFLQGFSVAQAATQLLDQLTAEAISPSIPALRLDNGDNHEDSPANIDELSDEQVDSMLTDMLVKDAVT
jgi:acyl carrier protein